MKHISADRSAELPIAVQLARFGLVAGGALLFAASLKFLYPESLPVGLALLIVPAGTAIALGKMGPVARVTAAILGWLGLMLSVVIGPFALAGNIDVSPRQADPVEVLFSL